jgi:hypothetical protein
MKKCRRATQIDRDYDKCHIGEVVEGGAALAAAFMSVRAGVAVRASRSAQGNTTRQRPAPIPDK